MAVGREALLRQVMNWQPGCFFQPCSVRPKRAGKTKTLAGIGKTFPSHRSWGRASTSIRGFAWNQQTTTHSAEDARSDCCLLIGEHPTSRIISSTISVFLPVNRMRWDIMWDWPKCNISYLPCSLVLPDLVIPVWAFVEFTFLYEPWFISLAITRNTLACLLRKTRDSTGTHGVITRSVELQITKSAKCKAFLIRNNWSLM